MFKIYSPIWIETCNNTFMSLSTSCSLFNATSKPPVRQKHFLIGQKRRMEGREHVFFVNVAWAQNITVTVVTINLKYICANEIIINWSAKKEKGKERACAQSSSTFYYSINIYALWTMCGCLFSIPLRHRCLVSSPARDLHTLWIEKGKTNPIIKKFGVMP